MLFLEAKSTGTKLGLACASLAILTLSPACSGKNVVTDGIPGQGQPQSVVPARPPTEAEYERWRSMIAQVPKPESACLVRAA